MAQFDLQQVNNETQDILHQLELYDDPYHQTATLAKKLRDVRRRRRTAKDELEKLTPLCEWIENNKAVIGQLQRLMGDMRKTERHHQNRYYIPKTTILED